MDQTLQQLGHLLLSSVPTIALFVLLHYYLKAVLYRPLGQVLEERRARTTGRIATAQQRLAEAESKLAEYEAGLRNARIEGYRGIETRRQAAAVAAQAELMRLRQELDHQKVQARQQLASETTQARAGLQEASRSLAQRLVERVLGRAAMPPGVGA